MRVKILKSISTISFFGFSLIAQVQATQLPFPSSWDNDWYTIDSGGGLISSSGIQRITSISQPDALLNHGEDLDSIRSGFLNSFPEDQPDGTPTAYLAPSNVSVSENDGMITLRVGLTSSPTSQASIQVFTTGISATPEVDFQSFSETLYINPGENFAEIDLFVTNDFIVEGDEQLAIHLSNPTNCVLSPRYNYQSVTIEGGDVGSSIHVSHSEIIFPDHLITPGPSIPEKFTISNLGSEPLEIEDILTDSDVFYLNYYGDANSVYIPSEIPFFGGGPNSPQLSEPILPGESLDVYVVFNPIQLISYSGKLLITSSAGNTPTYSVSLLGNGTEVNGLARMAGQTCEEEGFVSSDTRGSAEESTYDYVPGENLPHIAFSNFVREIEAQGRGLVEKYAALFIDHCYTYQNIAVNKENQEAIFVRDRWSIQPYVYNYDTRITDLPTIRLRTSPTERQSNTTMLLNNNKQEHSQLLETRVDRQFRTFHMNESPIEKHISVLDLLSFNETGEKTGVSYDIETDEVPYSKIQERFNDGDLLYIESFNKSTTGWTFFNIAGIDNVSLTPNSSLGGGGYGCSLDSFSVYNPHDATNGGSLGILTRIGYSGSNVVAVGDRRSCYNQTISDENDPNFGRFLFASWESDNINFSPTSERAYRLRVKIRQIVNSVATTDINAPVIRFRIFSLEQRNWNMEFNLLDTDNSENFRPTPDAKEYDFFFTVPKELDGLDTRIAFDVLAGTLDDENTHCATYLDEVSITGAKLPTPPTLTELNSIGRTDVVFSFDQLSQTIIDNELIESYFFEFEVGSETIISSLVPPVAPISEPIELLFPEFYPPAGAVRWRVGSVDFFGQIGFSEYDVIENVFQENLPIPILNTPERLTENAIQLFWHLPPSGQIFHGDVLEFNIYRRRQSAVPEPFARLNKDPWPVNYYYDDDLIEGVTYEYIVTSLRYANSEDNLYYRPNSQNESAQSNIVSISMSEGGATP